MSRSCVLMASTAGESAGAGPVSIKSRFKAVPATGAALYSLLYAFLFCLFFLHAYRGVRILHMELMFKDKSERT